VTEPLRNTIKKAAEASTALYTDLNPLLFVKIMSSRIRRGADPVLTGLLICLLLLPSCQVPDYLYYNFEDLHDYRIFPSIDIPAAPAGSVIPVAKNSADLKVPERYTEPGTELNFSDYLKKKKTVAFLVIRNDSLVYENYFDGYSRESVLPSFSIAKSFVSALVGIAIHEGHIRSLDQPITDFIPELKDARFHEVTLKDLVQMRSGIRYTEDYRNPFGSMPKFYYGENLKKYVMHLKVDGEPGEKYVYQSVNAELLGMALERATGKTLEEYLGEKIWEPAGMTPGATWNVDSEDHLQTKAFCCINAKAPDFARFGLLYLNRGVLDGDTIVPPAWVDESLLIQNNSLDSQGYPYGYFWRALPGGEFFAKGVQGQFIFVSPARHLVIVRFGKAVAGVPWVEFFRELALQL
jgi:CubicO group peptidase (beta-lactamase class C family)